MKIRIAGQESKHIVLRTMVLAASVAIVSGPALAGDGDMSVAAFLAKADALKAKGPMALFSSDIGLLKAEGQAAGAAYKAQLDAERKAGHPSSCPPKGTRVDGDDLMAQMHAYPAVARSRITVKKAMVDMFRAKFPCKP
jgi:hypothetical protein